MSVHRAFSAKHVLPENPSWIEFQRSDGDNKNWPTNTTREVDSEGHVNYMRVAALDDPLCIKWRVEVGRSLAQIMLMPGAPFFFSTFPIMSEIGIRGP